MPLTTNAVKGGALRRLWRRGKPRRPRSVPFNESDPNGA